VDSAQPQQQQQQQARDPIIVAEPVLYGVHNHVHLDTARGSNASGQQQSGESGGVMASLQQLRAMFNTEEDSEPLPSNAIGIITANTVYMDPLMHRSQYSASERSL